MEPFERISLFLLYLWCALPLAAAAGYFIFGTLHKYDLCMSYSGTKAYTDMMMFLGACTIVFWLIFVIGRLICAGDHMWHMAKTEPWHFLLLGMLTWSVVSTFRARNVLWAIIGTGYRKDGLLSYFIYAAVMGCGFLINSRERRHSVLKWFAGVANIIALLMMFQEWNMPLVTDYINNTRAAVFYNSNHLAYYLCMSILCLAGLFVYETSTKNQIYYALAMGFQTYVMIVNNTFGSYLAVLVGVVAVVIFGARKQQKMSWKMWIPVGIVLLLSLLSCLGGIPSSSGENLWDNIRALFVDTQKVASNAEDASSAGSGRILLWVTAVKMIGERPLFGWGPEMLYGEYARITGYDRPHNEYIQHAVFLGIPALLMYLAALLTLFIHQWKHLPKLQETTVIAAGAVVAYLFSAIFGNTMFYTTPYFFMLLGFAAGRPKG